MRPVRLNEVLYVVLDERPVDGDDVFTFGYQFEPR